MTHRRISSITAGALALFLAAVVAAPASAIDPWVGIADASAAAEADALQAAADARLALMRAYDAYAARDADTIAAEAIVASGFADAADAAATNAEAADAFLDGMRLTVDAAAADIEVQYALWQERIMSVTKALDDANAALASATAYVVEQQAVNDAFQAEMVAYFAPFEAATADGEAKIAALADYRAANPVEADTPPAEADAIAAEIARREAEIADLVAIVNAGFVEMGVWIDRSNGIVTEYFARVALARTVAFEQVDAQTVFDALTGKIPQADALYAEATALYISVRASLAASAASAASARAAADTARADARNVANLVLDLDDLATASPLLTFSGSAESQEVAAGEQIVARFTFVNDSVLDITNASVTVTAPADATVECDIVDGVVPAGATVTCDARHAVTADDLAAGSVAFEATLTGYLPIGPGNPRARSIGGTVVTLVAAFSVQVTVATVTPPTSTDPGGGAQVADVRTATGGATGAALAATGPDLGALPVAVLLVLLGIAALAPSRRRLAACSSTSTPTPTSQTVRSRPRR